MTTMEGWSIPEDLMINEILMQLPVKSLLRFRSVCKAWHSAISNRQFIELHRQHSQSKVHRVSGYQNPHIICTNIERLTEEGKFEHYFRLPWLQDWGIVMSSCDLIVLTFKDGYLLSNPATQDLVYLPCASWDEADIHLTGFGFVSSLGKYKVVSITFDTQDTCEVFTLGMDKSWRKGRSPPYPIPTSDHIPYVDGNLHMLSIDSEDRYDKLLVFNLEKEAWSVMVLPDEPVLHWLSELREMQGLLCFIRCIPNKRIDIWMLRDYANNVWSKDIVIDATPLSRMPDGTNFETIDEFGWFPSAVMIDGRILLQSFADCRWFYYDSLEGTIQLADQRGVCITNYAENLVPILGFRDQQFSSSSDGIVNIKTFGLD